MRIFEDEPYWQCFGFGAYQESHDSETMGFDFLMDIGPRLVLASTLQNSGDLPVYEILDPVVCFLQSTMVWRCA
jgi:hypothetical protein